MNTKAEIREELEKIAERYDLLIFTDHMGFYLMERAVANSFMLDQWQPHARMH